MPPGVYVLLLSVLVRVSAAFATMVSVSVAVLLAGVGSTTVPGTSMRAVLTSVPVALAALNLFWGLAALAGSAEAWASWAGAQTHPLMVIFNLIAIAAACFNSKTWFEAIPKAMPIQKGETFVPAQKLIGAAWVAFAVVFVLLVLTVLIFA